VFTLCGRIGAGFGTAGELPEADGVVVIRGCLVSADAEGGVAQLGWTDCPVVSCAVLEFAETAFLGSVLVPDVANLDSVLCREVL
jgi:hypothetical protein